MVDITDEMIEEAKSVNLVDYCKKNNIGLINENSRHPKLHEMDSLVLFPEGDKDARWYRFSRQEGGDAIAFVQYMDDTLSFKQAVLKLNNEDYISLPNKEIEPEPYEYQDNEVDEFDQAYNYLVNERKIDPILVESLKGKGLLAQDHYNNVVFKWSDFETGELVGANAQGTGHVKEGERSFKKIQRNSTRGKGFNVVRGHPKHIKFFESSIDMMSYMTLNQEIEEDTWYVSMEGLKDSVVKESLQTVGRHMGEMKEQDEEMTIESISFCVDNDEAGRDFAHSYIDSLVLDHGDEKKLLELDVPEEGDWNDALKQQVELQQKKQQIQEQNEIER